ncbi:hypothetical protein RvY_00576 [Ramazzottius varieornatus]|uniref:Prenyltransferase alpha-alpha toroid domain-containing protein n=1 Tax=Ramazzottius varieornatus TaxID=947166 RepID=A0A1D1UNN3_RAMVA|nr:hypothetical protein RvY_00576 [Ramazzottius varieornatus]
MDGGFTEPSDFQRTRHIKYFERMLDGVPAAFASQEPNLMTVVYFCVSGLDLLKAKESLQKRKETLVSFVYSLQCNYRLFGVGGFYGSLSDVSLNAVSLQSPHGFLPGPGLARTYATLCTLVILEDNLSGVDRGGIRQLLRHSQSGSGSFHGALNILRKDPSTFFEAFSEDYESDMRFVYCACAISEMTNDWSGIDVEKMLDFIWKSRTYEGGFAQVPGAECHGGSTYCAVASLFLLCTAKRKGLVPSDCDRSFPSLDELFPAERPAEIASGSKERMQLIRWLVLRQVRGFTGRPNKPEDSCYTFWIGASLKMLGASSFVDERRLNAFCMETQDAIIGGFAKWPSSRSDPMHAYLCISGLSMLRRYGSSSREEPDVSDEGVSQPALLRPVNPALNISIQKSIKLLGKSS